MTSGIYKATFKDGSIYIGKSINIENRWKQHTDDMLKGRHTKKMQNAYNLYGLPKFQILIPSHKDHIDILEGYVINAYAEKGFKLLNSDKVDAPSASGVAVFKAYTDKLLLSTADHIRMIAQLEYDTLRSSKEITILKQDLKEANEYVEIYEGNNVYCDARFRKELAKLKFEHKELLIDNETNKLRANLAEAKVAEQKAFIDKIKSNWFLRLFV